MTRAGPGLFVTGTDTGCGKTTVGCALARHARAQRLRVRILKPVETGCSEEEKERVALDARRLARAAGDERSPSSLCPYRLALPAAPSVAAAAEGLEIDPLRIESAYREAASDSDLVLVEGAGGLRVPVAPELEMVDLAARLGLPLVVVCRARLGTLNHTLLTLEAAARRGLPVVGVVISHTDPALSRADRANLDALRRELPVRCLGELAFGAQAIEPTPDLRALVAPPGSS
ncbi:MAG: dethiobiotin synthase [Myxococcota bacterium]